MKANGIVGVAIPQSITHGRIQASCTMLGLRKFFEAIHSEPDSEFEANTSPGLRLAALLRGTCAPLDVKCGSLSHLLSTAFIQQLYTQKYNKLALANTAVFVRVLGGRDGLSHSGKIVVGNRT